MRFGAALAGDGHAAACRFRPQVAVTLAGFGKAGGQGAGGTGKNAAFLPAPCRPQQGRDGVLFQGCRCGKGVAGQAEHQFAGDLCRQHGAAGLLCHARKEHLCPQPFQHGGQIVLLPYRNAAAGNDGIAAGQKFPQLAGDDLRVVRAVPPLYGKAQLPQPGGVLDAVGIVDLAGSPRFTGGQQLTAGGKNAHGQGAVYRHLGIALPRQHTQMGGGQRCALGGNDGSGGDIPAPEHHVLLRFQA